MKWWKSLQRLVHEPPPEFLFEFSDLGIAWARPAGSLTPAFEGLPEGALVPSPVSNNLVDPVAVESALFRITGPAPQRRRRTAAVLLPDYAARIVVLDFENLPANAQEQESLIRFRVKKSVALDVDSAILRYFPQTNPRSGYDVVVVIAAPEVLAPYEALFRNCNLHAGFITISCLTALELVQEPAGSMALLARLAGRTLSLMVLQETRLKFVRCIELGERSVDEILGVVSPTAAYAEDELHAHLDSILLCGFSDLYENVERRLKTELTAQVAPLRARFGAPSAADAGVYGYLEALTA